MKKKNKNKCASFGSANNFIKYYVAQNLEKVAGFKSNEFFNYLRILQHQL